MKLTKKQIFNLKTHYDVVKDLPMASGYSFKEWINSYKDFPMILKSMAAKQYNQE